MLVSEACPPRAERLLKHRLLDRPPTFLMEMQEEVDSWLECELCEEVKLAGDGKEDAS